MDREHGNLAKDCSDLVQQRDTKNYGNDIPDTVTAVLQHLAAHKVARTVSIAVHHMHGKH